MNNKVVRMVCVFFSLLLMTVFLSGIVTAFADDSGSGEAAAAGMEESSGATGNKAIAAAVVVGAAAAAGALGMGIAIAKSADSMARQPEASGKINSAMMLGLVFIETVVIYALIVAILIIFVL